MREGNMERIDGEDSGEKANQTNSNQLRNDEIIILKQLRDGKWVKNIFPKIRERLRLAHGAKDVTLTVDTGSIQGACIRA